MAINLKKPTNNIEEATADFDQRDLENEMAYEKTDAEKAEAAIEAENLKSEQQKQDAYAKDLSDRQAMAARTEAIRKENSDAYKAKELARKEYAAEKAQTLRQEREKINFDPEFLSNLKAGAKERTLTKEQLKVFNEKAKNELNAISEKTVDLRNANFASEIPVGSTQVISKDTISLLQSGDRQSTASLITQLEHRSGKLNQEHDDRISTMQERASFERENGNNKAADYFDLKIEHENTAHERDRAMNVLAQYEYMDADRGDTSRIQEQRDEIKKLTEKADALYERVEKMEAFASVKEETRDHDYEKTAEFEAEVEELNAEFDDFSDIETDDQKFYDQQYEDSLIDTDDSDALADEFRAEKAMEDYMEAVNSDREFDTWEPENDEDRATRQLDEEVERHNEAIERGDFEDASASLDQNPDIKTEVDEDPRTHEEVEEDAIDGELSESTMKYEMDRGLHEYEKPESIDDAFGEPDFDDIDFGKPEMADAASVEAVSSSEIDDRVYDFEFDAETGEILNDTNNEVASVSADDLKSFESKDFINSENTAAFDPDSDKAFKADFNARLQAGEKEIETLSQGSDYQKTADAMSRQNDTLKEYNAYLSDRETLTANKEKLDTCVDKLSKNETSEADKGEYFKTLDKANDNLNASSEKPWGASMQAELKEKHSENEKKLDAVSEGRGQKLHAEHREKSDVDSSETVKVTKQDVERIQQMQIAQHQETEKSSASQH